MPPRLQYNQRMSGFLPTDKQSLRIPAILLGIWLLLFAWQMAAGAMAPSLTKGLPEGEITAARAFADRLHKEFTPGTEETALISALARDGFGAPQPAYSIVSEDTFAADPAGSLGRVESARQKVEKTARCKISDYKNGRHGWQAQWCANAGGRLFRVSGTHVIDRKRFAFSDLGGWRGLGLAAVMWLTACLFRRKQQLRAADMRRGWIYVFGVIYWLAATAQWRSEPELCRNLPPQSAEAAIAVNDRLARAFPDGAAEKDLLATLSQGAFSMLRLVPALTEDFVVTKDGELHRTSAPEPEGDGTACYSAQYVRARICSVEWCAGRDGRVTGVSASVVSLD